MKPLFIALLGLLLLNCCNSSNHPKRPALSKPQKATKKPPLVYPPVTDSTFFLFGDSSYKVNVHIFDQSNDYDESKANTILTFKYHKNTLIKDSLFCMDIRIEFKDFNNDKINDLLVFNYTGGRANPTYHLYAVNPSLHRLIRVKGFEKIPNPEMDAENNIITGSGLAGSSVFWSFYRINRNNKLINLGHSYEAGVGDSTGYPKGILKDR